MKARTPLPPLAAMTEACSKARADALADIRGNPELRGLRWHRAREPQLLAIAADGQRLNDGCWTAWKRRKKEVVELYDRYSEAAMIVVDSGINLYERPDAEDYVPVYWQAVIWEDTAEVDALVRAHTAFASLADMLTPDGCYRPSCDVREPAMEKIADAYDRLAAQQGDERRAYRYGKD